MTTPGPRTSAGPEASAPDAAVPPVSRGVEAAFFDLDKTVIAKAAMAAFRRPLYHGGLLDRRSVLRAGLAQLVYLHLGASEQRLERIRSSVLRLTKGWERDQVVALIAETLELVVEPIIYAEALELINAHQAAGRLVVIVSASPEEIVAPLGRHLGVDAVIASRAAVDEEGRYTGRMAFYAYGHYKAEAMRALASSEHIDLSASFAYSDSATDLPMLEAVGHPVAVNPDRVLARIARERGFELLRFERPVHLRDAVRTRVQDVQMRPALAVSAVALALAAGALVLGWWLGARLDGAQRALGALARALTALVGPRSPAGGEVSWRSVRGAQALRGHDAECGENGEDQDLLHHGRSLGASGTPGARRGRCAAPLRCAAAKMSRRQASA